MTSSRRHRRRPPTARVNTTEGSFWIVDGRVENARHPSEQPVSAHIIEMLRAYGWVD
jgi:hypothetical protein